MGSKLNLLINIQVSPDLIWGTEMSTAAYMNSQTAADIAKRMSD